jgi:hypothetical protein
VERSGGFFSGGRYSVLSFILIALPLSAEQGSKFCLRTSAQKTHIDYQLRRALGLEILDAL